MFKSIILKLKNNKNYLIGLIGVLVVSLITMSIFYNKSIVNYDGWYNIYANDILNGRKPYTDFHFLMPPVFLYLWTLLQKIFGDFVIVAHTASMICKALLLVGLYHTFTRFFNYKISFLASILTLAIMTTVVFDNCTFSYNEFATLLSIATINILISFIEKLYQNIIKYEYIVLLAICNTLLFFTKQTHGMIVPFAALIILISLLWHKISLIKFLKIAGVYIISSILMSIFIFIPILTKFSLTAYIENVYISASAKGSISDIFHVPLNLIARYDYLWPIFTFGIVSFSVFIMKKYNICKFVTGDKNTESDGLPNNLVSTFICLLVLFCAYALTVKLSQVYLLSGLVKTITHVANQIGCICEFVILFMAIFYFFKSFIFREDINVAKRLILFGVFFSTAFAMMLSSAQPYFIYYIYGLGFATLLNYKFKYSKLLNIVVFSLTIFTLGLALSTKMSVPIIFHGWQGVNITTERKVSKLPFLKGMSLSKIEVDMYEEIHDILNKYLSSEDKIFAFINNQVFYQLLNRKPFYSDNYSLYWDVCSESCAESVYNEYNVKEISKLPPAIIYLQYPNSSISFHELLFRSGNKDNAQRKIDIKIKNDIKNNNYRVVKTYNSKEYYRNNHLLNEDYKKMNELEENYKKITKNYNYDMIDNSETWNEIIELEQQQKKIIKQFKKKLTDVNSRYIIENNYELKILIRNDLYTRKK